MPPPGSPAKPRQPRCSIPSLFHTKDKDAGLSLYPRPPGPHGGVVGLHLDPTHPRDLILRAGVQLFID